MMKQGSPIVRTASKDILARLLASEDLIVQHHASAETASFNTHSRILTLPVWQNMDNAMYDMLVGHEVSHALHTPADGWQEFIGENEDVQERQMILNVCEDVRIERLIKKKFPGLRRDFSHAYKSLHDRDIFQLQGKSIVEMHLVDRINLYYKGEIYGQATIPFSTEERQWITRLDAADTFEEIIAIAEDLTEKLSKSKKKMTKTALKRMLARARAKVKMVLRVLLVTAMRAAKTNPNPVPDPNLITTRAKILARA